MSDPTPTPTPADVAPKATDAPPAPAEPAAAAPPAEKPAEQPPASNVWDKPESAKAEIERLRRENAKDRTTAKQTAADEARTTLATEIGRALGLVKDEPADPAKLTEQLTASQVEAKRARVELAVFRNAEAAGADPQALLDSASFLAKVRDIDPSDKAAVSAAISEAVASNPRLGVAPASRVPAPDPGQGTSGAGSVDTLDAQIAEAEKAGDYARAITLKRAKARKS